MVYGALSLFEIVIVLSAHIPQGSWARIPGIVIGFVRPCDPQNAKSLESCVDKGPFVRRSLQLCTIVYSTYKKASTDTDST